MTLPVNKKLVSVGSYRLTGRRLGRGNFAKVEEALHSVLKTKVAIKVMNLNEIKEEYVLRNLHREARIMSRLSHPCIVSLYETMQYGSVFYLVTELISGGDLCTFIKSQRGGKLEEKPTKNFARQLVSAVAYMHNMGIVHRDLKMENIMLNETKTILKIVDFGLSNTYTADTPLHTHCGSPEYAAPELFVTGKLYGPQVDLWSVGVILYGMVMGQLPFLTSRDSRISSQERRKYLLAQINRGLAPLHRKALAIYTLEFRAMISRLLVPDPLKRIHLQELIRHPWLTDRSKRPLRTSGLSSLDYTWRTIIYREIAKLLNVDALKVEYNIRAEPHGYMSGMYNILAFRKMHQSEPICKKTTPVQRPATATITQQNLPQIVDTNRPGTACECNQQMTASQKRKDMLSSNTNITAKAAKQPSILSNPVRVYGTRTITKTYNLRSNAASIEKALTCRTNNSSHHDSNHVSSRRTKSEPISQKPPSISITPGAHTAERALKRKSAQLRHQASTTSDPIRKYLPRAKSGPPHSSGTTSAAVRAPRRNTTTSQKTATATGYKSAPPAAQTPVKTWGVRPVTTTGNPTHDCFPVATDIGKGSSNHPQINACLKKEPIARSIAGYVDKYMNSHGAKVDKRVRQLQQSGQGDDHQCKIKCLRTNIPFATTGNPALKHQAFC